VSVSFFLPRVAEVAGRGRRSAAAAASLCPRRCCQAGAVDRPGAAGKKKKNRGAAPGRRTTVQIHHRISFRDLFFHDFCRGFFRARILQERWICTTFLLPPGGHASGTTVDWPCCGRPAGGNAEGSRTGPSDYHKHIPKKCKWVQSWRNLVR